MTSTVGVGGVTTGDEIRQSLVPLFQEARERRLWFYCSYQDLWFSPDELEKEQTAGKFVWGAANWRLRNPEELVAEKELALQAARRAYDRAVERVAERGL
jgi:hypothetical protein